MGSPRFDHREVRRRGVAHRGGVLSGYALRRDDGRPSRVQFEVAKGVLRGAVDRNRLKRQMRETARRLKLVPGFDCLIVVRRDEGNQRALEERLCQILVSLGVAEQL